MPDDVDDPERVAAHVAAYELVEQAQTVLGVEGADELTDLAARRGWREVACLVEYARLIWAQMVQEDTGDHLRVMRTYAEQDGDPALLAIVLATEVELAGQQPDDNHELSEGALARAVAHLYDPQARVVDQPTGLIACALVYRTFGIHELEAEMYARAVQVLDRIPARYARVRELNARAIVFNRVEVQLELACANDQAGYRADAAAIAAEALDTPTPDLGDVPAEWVAELGVIRDLLGALAGRPPAGGAAAPRENHRLSGYLLLAAAVRHRDAGDLAEAARLADLAASQLSHAELTGHYTRLQAVWLAALDPPPSQAACRYANELVSLRERTRARAVGSARARIDAERIRLENERLTERAYVDELTGLANRHAYNRHLQRLSGGPSGYHVAVLMIDVDRFKWVNDRFGHPIGDEVLRRLAALLTDSVRPTDLVARLGGDEFVVVMECLGSRDAHGRANALVDKVVQYPWATLVDELGVSVSIGISNGSAADVLQLLQDADRGLYAAKRNGRNQVGIAPVLATSSSHT
jgi:diguanylate cyclase (GGDEF)-like protein